MPKSREAAISVSTSWFHPNQAAFFSTRHGHKEYLRRMVALFIPRTRPNIFMLSAAAFLGPSSFIMPAAELARAWNAGTVVGCEVGAGFSCKVGSDLGCEVGTGDGTGTTVGWTVGSRCDYRWVVGNGVGVGCAAR